MKILIANLTLLILLSLSFQSIADDTKSGKKKCDQIYAEALQCSQNGESQRAAGLLEKILTIDKSYYMACFALADLSHERGDFKSEKGYLQQGIQLSGDQYPAAYKFLAQIEYRDGDYAAALGSVTHFFRLKKNPSADEFRLLANCTFAAESVLKPCGFTPVPAGDSINTPADEYWPSLNAEANELVFTRIITHDETGRKITIPQEDFYASRQKDGVWERAILLGETINTPDENEGAQTLSADGRILIFTACNRPDGIGRCDLYISVRKKSGWTIPVNMGAPVNSPAWESQPSLSADGSELYFVSSRAGGKGKLDLWMSPKRGVDAMGIPQFGEPVNLSALNSSGNDFSPFIHADGKTFYFASDGYPGFGDSDLYISRREKGTFSAPVNLGYPINTRKKEEGLVVEASGSRAWFAAGQDTSGLRDLFYFDLPEEVKPSPVAYFKGKVLDSVTRTLISANVQLSDLQSGATVSQLGLRENEGDFLVCLPSGKSYSLTITSPGYLFSNVHVPVSEDNTIEKPKEETFLLEKIELGKISRLNNIFFETDSWQLKPESAVEISEIALFMSQNPTIRAEISGHTDPLGTPEYNLQLSQKRAEAVVAALVAKGTDPKRLRARGYGHTRPVAANKSVKDRALNRRTEFCIVDTEALSTK